MMRSNPADVGVQQQTTAIAVRATALSKRFRYHTNPRSQLAYWINRRLRPQHHQSRPQDIWALRDLDLTVHQGETVGILGLNGSGKSTLLQLICGVLEPTSGTIEVNGRIGALLELGSGFSPEFSGLENVYLNAALLGLKRRETEAKLDQILAFADIGEAIHKPIKTYSSGMVMRLAFAVHANTDPDILIVDEALAVGDELFQRKCYAHLDRLKEQGTSILLVTHNCAQIVQQCDYALLLHKGQAQLYGQAAKVTISYQRLMHASDEEWIAEFAKNKKSVHKPSSRTISTESDRPTNCQSGWLEPTLQSQSCEIYPSKGGSIIDAWLENDSGATVNVLPFGADFTITIAYKAEIDLNNISFTCLITNHTGQKISGQAIPELVGSQGFSEVAHIRSGQRLQIRFGFHGSLWPGHYFVGAAMVKRDGAGNSFVHRVMDFRAFKVVDTKPRSSFGACALQSTKPEVRWQ